MCKLRAKKDYRKHGAPVKGWEIEGQARGARFTLYFGATQNDKHDVFQYRALVERLEKEYKTRGAVYEGTLDEVKRYPELFRRLIDKGVLAAPSAELYTIKRALVEWNAAGRKEGKSENTLRNQWNSLEKLQSFFGADTTLDCIDEEAALAFAADIDRKVTAGGIAGATRAGYIRDIKSAFNWARDNGIVAANPFDKIKKGSFRNEARKEYIDLERARAVLEACRNSDNPHEWRALFALARFQGLRVPSETRALRWQDVDFDTMRLDVTSPKTQRYVGKGRRVMPLFPPTATILRELHESTPRGRVFVFDALLIQMRAEANLRTGFLRILDRAGLDHWTKPFSNLRASAATDVSQTYGAKAESQWLGHSERVADDHYLQVLPSALNNEAGLFADLPI